MTGTVDTVTLGSAMNAIQRRGLVIISVNPINEKKGNLFSSNFTIFERVKTKDVVLLSKQLSTLFAAQVSALKVFRLLANESDNPALRGHLKEIADALQGGASISKALSDHPKIFSNFYVNMVKAGEESGRLDQTFTYLAENLERSFNLLSKAKNAMIYPIFVIVTFVGVMIFMLVAIIPKLTASLTESGQEIPIYTKVVIAVSDVLVHYGLLALFALIIGGFFFWRWSQTPQGKVSLSKTKISIPYVGTLYRKLYLARIAGNVSTMLTASIPIVKTLEITAEIIDNQIFKNIVTEASNDVKGGLPISTSLAKHPEIPGIMVAMFKVGEETGSMGDILTTMARFYEREVIDAVDALVGLIEPALVVALGVGVGFLLASVLIPIYNVAMSIS